MPRGVCAIAVLLALVGDCSPAAAQPQSPADLPAPVPTEEPRRTRRAADISFLDAPVVVGTRAAPVSEPAPATPVGFVEAPPDPPRRTRAATIARPDAVKPVSADRIETAAKVDPAKRTDDAVDDLLSRRAKDGDKPAGRSAWKFGDKLDGKESACQSD